MPIFGDASFNLKERESNTMRKLFLMTASVLALTAGAAMAGQHGGDYGKGDPKGGHYTPPSLEAMLGIAVGVNAAQSSGNNYQFGPGYTASASIDSSFNGAKGIANQNQNAGANSALQNSLALAYVEGCNCATGNPSHLNSVGAGASVALALNYGSIDGSGDGLMPQSSPQGWDKDHHGDRDHRPPPPSFVNGSIDGSYNGFTGVAQVNQNAGPNNLLQNATALAVVGPMQQASAAGTGALAVSGNIGEVAGTTDVQHGVTGNASISNSFRGATGIANVNQSTGSNSVLQNSAALSTITTCGCSADDLSVSVAAAGNLGRVANSYAAASGGSSNMWMSNSFNGAQGVMQVSQNGGANSVLQNSTAIGTVSRTH